MATLDPIFHQLFEAKPSKGDLKRLEIIKAAVKSIARDGFEGGTFESIAKSLKTRRSHVAYYYKDRNQLLTAVIEYIIATAQEITIELIRSQSTPLEQILAMSDAVFVWAKKYPEQARILVFFYYTCSSEPRFKKLNTQIREAGVDRIKSLLGMVLKEHPQALGRLSLEESAKALQSIMTGLAIDFVSTEKSTLDLQDLAQKSCQAWIEAVLNQKPAKKS
jgi:TetR/AcrR family transcriptional regulator, transcriptional repressor of bet genes